MNLRALLTSFAVRIAFIAQIVVVDVVLGTEHADGRSLERQVRSCLARIRMNVGRLDFARLRARSREASSSRLC